ncbi:MAG: hypothetical protein ACE5H1_01850 [Thermodesulfobacteriota bacterium]
MNRRDKIVLHKKETKFLEWVIGFVVQDFYDNPEDFYEGAPTDTQALFERLFEEFGIDFNTLAKEWNITSGEIQRINKLTNRNLKGGR